MKYVLVALCSLTLAGSALFYSFNQEACCEYIGLMAPEGVSEVPGVKHAEIEPDSEIVVVGINAKTPHLEVWNKQRWNGVQNALESESDEWSEELARHGFSLR